MKTNGIVTIISFSFLIAAAFYLNSIAESSKIFNASPEVRIISEPYLAESVWEESGVKNRILILFDRRINAEPGGFFGLPDEKLAALDNNYIYVSLRKNIVRKIYHVIPDAAWGEVERYMNENKYAGKNKDYFRTNIEGSPVLIMRIKDITEIKEPVLASINTGFWDDAGMEKITALFREKKLRSDLVTISGDIDPGKLAVIESYAGNNK